ncbi:MAG: IPT/TIG domain-containing protein, partial [Gemmatimonadetes bacterium]|nr:IPT/TIG domain-containing protein [Gemmatimonadota bacterium]
VRYVQVRNDAGGIMSWTASLAFKTGAGWLTIDPSSGVNNGTIRIDALPSKVGPGTYEATLTIDAGALAGSRSVPVTLTVTQQAPAPQQPVAAPKVVVRSFGNLARPESATVAPGSLVTIGGTGFSGQSVAVTFDGIDATVLSMADDRVNALAPASLAGKSSAELVVTVDGERSAPRVIALAEIAPAIFPNGVLNTDYSVNGELNGAPVGSVLQIYATGLLAPVAGPVSVKLHDRVLSPAWAGHAPGIPGVQQVNVAIPGDLPAMTTEVLVCGHGSASPEPICSVPVKVTLRDVAQ